MFLLLKTKVACLTKQYTLGILGKAESVTNIKRTELLELSTLNGNIKCLGYHVFIYRV